MIPHCWEMEAKPRQRMLLAARNNVPILIILNHIYRCAILSGYDKASGKIILIRGLIATQYILNYDNIYLGGPF